MKITDLSLPVDDTAIRVRTYEPERPAAAGILWIHGGAFFMNDIDVPEVHWVAQQLAESGIAVVSPEYRLASQTVHFPVLTDDCVAAWVWATAGHAPFTHQPRTWHIGGGSAGGNLAASVAMQVRDGAKGGPLPQSTVLVYPAMHSPIPVPSEELASKLAVLPREELYSDEDVARINLTYAGKPELLQHPYAFPGHGELRGMPPALVINSEHDPLRASGEAYAQQLAAAGVDTTVLRELGAHHGHLNFPEQPAAQSTVRRIIDWLSPSTLLGSTHEPSVSVARAGETSSGGESGLLTHP